LRTMLLDVRKSLAGFLMAFHSYVWFIVRACSSTETRFHDKYKVLHRCRPETNYGQVLPHSNSFTICCMDVCPSWVTSRWTQYPWWIT
jgi:hypothetical protein